MLNMSSLAELRFDSAENELPEAHMLIIFGDFDELVIKLVLS